MARDEAGCPMDTSCRREWQKGSDVVVRVELRVSTTTAPGCPSAAPAAPPAATGAHFHVLGSSDRGAGRKKTPASARRFVKSRKFTAAGCATDIFVQP